MYRVCVLSTGKYHNVVVGNRYCFSRKHAVELANMFADKDCILGVQKFARIGSCFIWAEAEDITRIWENEDGIYRILSRKELKEMFFGKRKGAE